MYEKDWSPTSDRLVIAVAGNPQRLFLTDVDGVDTAYITPPNVNAGMPSWHPSGEWIAYVKMGEKTADIWLIRPDGTENHLLIARAAYPAWSPDGQRLAFSRPTDSATALWTVKMDGSDLQQLTFP
jgi:TolB protein